MEWQKKIKSATSDEGHFQSNLDWIARMNNAINYIESHLDSNIDYNEAAKRACCSVYHFQRFFTFVADISLSEYVRRRRLTLAAFELQNSYTKVIDIAIKYGYESAEAFTRAFKNMQGVTPTAARDSGIQLKAYPCMTFHISIRGDAEMNYRIEQKEAFKMYGISTEISTVDNQNFYSIPAFWEKCRTDGTMKQIREESNLKEDVPLHAAMYNCTIDSHSYMIGYFSPRAEESEKFSIIDIHASTWAVFPSEKLSMIEATKQAQIMWKRIFTEWFATSGYELAENASEMELHYNVGDGMYITEIWIPIVKNG